MILTKATFALCFFVLVVLVSLSVLVQVIDWKFSSPKWPIVCRWGTLNPTHSLTHCSVQCRLLFELLSASHCLTGGNKYICHTQATGIRELTQKDVVPVAVQKSYWMQWSPVCFCWLALGRAPGSYAPRNQGDNWLNEVYLGTVSVCVWFDRTAYNKEIKDPKQPLLLNHPKKKDITGRRNQVGLSVTVNH